MQDVFVRIQELKQESISVKCKPPACQPYVLNKRTCLNKFEHLRRMSLYSEVPGQGKGRSVYAEVQCLMGDGHVGAPLWKEWLTGEQAQMKTLAFHNFVDTR